MRYQYLMVGFSKYKFHSGGENVFLQLKNSFGFVVFCSMFSKECHKLYELYEFSKLGYFNFILA